MPEISAQLLGGPYSGTTGRLEFRDEPPRSLTFRLDSEAGPSGLIVPTSSSVTDKLTAFYQLVDERPRKVQTVDDQNRVRSEKGVRYRYDPKSPCEELFVVADAEALLEASAREQVDATRKLLLADSWEQARKAKRSVERIGDLTPAHVGRLVSHNAGEPRRYGGHRRDFTRDGGVAITLDGEDVAAVVDDEILLLDERDNR